MRKEVGALALVVTEHLARLLEVNLPHDWVPRRFELRPVLTEPHIAVDFLHSHCSLQTLPLWLFVTL